MCTGLTLETKDGNHIFGRSLDIPFEFNQQVLLVPRNLELKNAATKEIYKSKYAILGMGTIIDNHPMFADGFNEKGLSCAGLNFGELAIYEDENVACMDNIGPYDFILWALTNFSNTIELKEGLKNLNIVKTQFNSSTPIAPLHWITYDTNGQSLVIEKVAGKLNIYDNPIGVLTNLPSFDWHLTNLTQYINIKSKETNKVRWCNFEFCSFSQGSGAFGLPGDYTSPSRFVRTAFLKNNIKCIENEIDGITAFFHILSSCDVPEGSVTSTTRHYDKTIYSSAMCLESGIYYYHNYNNRQITAIKLLSEDLNSSTIKSYVYRNKQTIYFEN